MMVKAGKPVDDVIDELLPHFHPATSSSTAETRFLLILPFKRTTVQAKGFRYIGTGVSRGEEGALLGQEKCPGGTARRIS